MLDSAVLLEVEEGAMIVRTQVEVATGGDELIALRRGDRDDLARWGDDGASADELAPFFRPRFGLALIK